MATILIVDDESDAVNILKLMLEKAEFDILTAENGQQGVQMARQARPDLIIADVLMPVMDGYGMYKELKNDPVTRHIPVIILTARGAMESAFDAIGADCFMEKPVEMTTLTEKITELLTRSACPSSKKRYQKVLIAGTYPEVVDEIYTYVVSLGHDAHKAYTAADIIKESVHFGQDVLILEVQMEEGSPSSDVIRAVRLFPNLKGIPILLYSYYHVSDLGNSDFRNRMLNIEKAKDACISAGGIQYFDRYNRDTFREWVAKYL
jgi:CheY-like chemotaxis protein